MAIEFLSTLHIPHNRMFLVSSSSANHQKWLYICYEGREWKFQAFIWNIWIVLTKWVSYTNWWFSWEMFDYSACKCPDQGKFERPIRYILYLTVLFNFTWFQVIWIEKYVIWVPWYLHWKWKKLIQGLDNLIYIYNFIRSKVYDN